MNRCDGLKIQILRYLNNEFSGSEIIVGSVWNNHATLIGIVRPREIVGWIVFSNLWIRVVQGISKTLQAMGYAG
jgi:hypothetical protein